MVREMGLEPIRQRHTPLKRACLPIPALAHRTLPILLNFKKFVNCFLTYFSHLCYSVEDNPGVLYWLRGANALTHEPDLDNSNARANLPVGSDYIKIIVSLCLPFGFQNLRVGGFFVSISTTFSLSIMSDDFIAKILHAIHHTDTSKIKSHTTALATSYSGACDQVLLALRSCFMHANDDKTHMTMHGTCTNTAEPLTPPPQVIALPAWGGATSFPVLCDFSFYPLATEDLQTHQQYATELAQAHNLWRGDYLQGDVRDIFDFLNDLLHYASAQLPQFVLQFTLSVNSPTKQM